jgi:cytochrome c553
MRAFRDGARLSGVMSEVAARLDDEDIREIAAYFERLPPRQPDTAANGEAIERGRTIATEGLPARDVPACMECHGPTDQPKNPAYPALSAQHARYLTGQLALLQQRRRGGTANVDLMHAFVDRLNETDIIDVASYYATLPRIARAATSPPR